jgi:hypothetical protein
MWGYAGIWCSPNTLKSPQILFPKNTLLWWGVFIVAKITLVWWGFVGISRDYPLQTRPSKQPIGDFPGYGIIPSDPHKYTKALFTSRVFEGMGGDYFVSRDFSDRLFTSPGFEGIIPGYPHKSPTL